MISGHRQECWSPEPWDRSSFPTILNKLKTFARLGDVALALREFKPMQVMGGQSNPLQPKLRQNFRRHHPKITRKQHQQPLLYDTFHITVRRFLRVPGTNISSHSPR